MTSLREHVAVAADRFASPFHVVFDALSAGLRRTPQLQILGAVVIALAILVVHVFVGGERASECLRHDETMLEDVMVASSKRSEERTIFFGNSSVAQKDIAGLFVDATSTTPHRGSIIASASEAAHTMTGPVRFAFQIVPYQRPLHPTTKFATRAFDFRTRPDRTVLFHDARFARNNCRMIREWVEFHRWCHV